jgi:prepilin-type N-terminal cleavage/methylation domain-containing protein
MLGALMRASYLCSSSQWLRVSSGMTLMECVLAMALFAVAIPGLMLVMAHASSGSKDSSMEAAAQRAIRWHACEIMHRGWPEGVGVKVCAHDATGACVGWLDEESHQHGLGWHQGRRVSYLVVAAKGDGSAPTSGGLLPLHLSLEYPAAAPVDRRQRIELHTAIQP